MRRTSGTVHIGWLPAFRYFVWIVSGLFEFFLRVSREASLGFDFSLRHGEFFPGQDLPVTSKLALQWLSYLAPGVIGSALGLVGPVSVYCD